MIFLKGPLCVSYTHFTFGYDLYRPECTIDILGYVCGYHQQAVFWKHFKNVFSLSEMDFGNKISFNEMRFHNFHHRDKQTIRSFDFQKQPLVNVPIKGGRSIFRTQSIVNEGALLHKQLKTFSLLTIFANIFYCRGLTGL